MSVLILSVSLFFFCINLLHTFLSVISVYIYIVYIVVACVLSYQSIMWLDLYKVIGGGSAMVMIGLNVVVYYRMWT